MHTAYRSFVFYFFSAIFVVSAPLAVLYTAGYRINLNNNRVQQTGALALATSPRGADVVINGITQKSRTPLVMQRLLPGPVTVTMSKRGYHSFTQQTDVSAGKTSYMSALLFADAEPTVVMESSGILAPTFDRSGRYVAYGLTRGNQAIIRVFDVLTLEDRSLTTTSFEQASLRILATAQENSFIINDSTQEEVIDVAGITISPEIITTLLLGGIPEITLEDNGSNIEVRRSDTKTLIGLLPLDTYTVLERDDRFAIITNSRDVPFIVSLEQDAVVDLSTRLAAYDWLPEEHALLWTDGSEVSLYLAESQEKTFITRQSMPVLDIDWHPTGDAFFLTTSTSIQAVDRNSYTSRLFTTLTEDLGIVTVGVEDNGRALHYLTETPENNQVFRLNLVR
ncbi:PEGA domain-containing protein [Patescibacteria group bacterium]|nr:PEGA domain-containing protein [Patescibacteria group bacterium]